MIITNDIVVGIMIPFIGTCIGAMFVFFMYVKSYLKMQKLLLGFASGVMVAASFWSLILPSIDMSEKTLKSLSFIPAALGIILGMLFLYGMDKLIASIYTHKQAFSKALPSSKENMMLMLAVTLHNIPEGMAVGVAFASCFNHDIDASMSAAFILALGIAIQNIPEGAIISLPLICENIKKGKAFMYGCLSGIVEPIAAYLTIWLSHYIEATLPYLLTFAAGAMLYVVVDELIPETAYKDKNKIGVLGFMLGFIVMMSLDVALG